MLEVAQPRLPCFKLGLRMGDPASSSASPRPAPGRVPARSREGDIGAGDEIEVTSRPAHGVTSALVSRAILREPELLGRRPSGARAARRAAAWMQERAAAHDQA